MEKQDEQEIKHKNLLSWHIKVDDTLCSTQCFKLVVCCGVESYLALLRWVALCFVRLYSRQLF